jgi:xanthine dehydrogenase accessory factor
MYAIAAQLESWLAAGREVVLARVVQTQGISSRDRAATIGYSPGLPLAGSLFGGAAADRLAAMLAGFTRTAGWLDLAIADPEARQAGLACGGTARLFVQPAATIPEAAWPLLVAERPVALLTDTETGQTRIAEFAEDRALRTGTSQTLLQDRSLLSAFWPTPRILVIGGGTIAEALQANAALLGWSVTVAQELRASLTAADNVVVLEHDLDISGRALRTALASEAGYIGALGSRHTQGRRAAWLAEHGVTDIDAVHGPAGLDIGSRTPAEIAVSILAEIISVRR